jgi:rRNA maturation RNase YbeY
VTRAVYLGPWRIDLTVRDGIETPVSGCGAGMDRGRGTDRCRRPRTASIGLILSDDAELAVLNADHLGKTGATMCCRSRSSHHGGFRPIPACGRRIEADRGSCLRTAARSPPHLGDIVISVERRAEQAESGRGGQTGDVRWSAADELRLLATHGTLHICGWDHAEPGEEVADARARDSDVLTALPRIAGRRADRLRCPGAVRRRLGCDGTRRA